MARKMKPAGQIVSFEDLRIRLRGTRKSDAAPSNTLIFLQCPIGPIGRNLLNAARDAGFTPMKINFNGGDSMFANSKFSINYTGRPEDWQAWFASFIELVKPVGVVLMGDMRPIHRVAVECAGTYGVPVFCLEEGYMRPNFVTVEKGGVNANSPLRRNFPAMYASRTKSAPEAKPEAPMQIGSDMFWAVSAVCWYYGAKVFGSLRFRHYQHHRDRPVVPEVALWIRGYILKLLRASRNKSKILDLIEHRENKYFVVALQVADDMQLRCHGRNWSNQLLLNRAIKAFAASAPEGTHLVIKGHPLDRGRYNYGELARKVAALAGCEDRVHYLDDGSMSLLLRYSLGLVTVNSTSGISALHHRKPLLAVGDALYSIDGLVNPADGEDCIERFFADPKAPDPDMADYFLQLVQSEALVNGSFYNKTTLAFTARNVVARIAELLQAEDASTQPSELAGSQPAVPQTRANRLAGTGR